MTNHHFLTFNTLQLFSFEYNNNWIGTTHKRVPEMEGLL